MSIHILSAHFNKWACLYWFGLLTFETPESDRSLFYIEWNNHTWHFGIFWLRII
jgi:hypothetical protein